MRSEIRKNYQWQDARIPQAIEILRQNAMHMLSVKVAAPSKDMRQATDLIISVDGGDVALRMRRPGCRFRELTIRAYSNGYRTELDKLREGFARWYLYCWMQDNQTVGEWMLIDLDRMRESGLLDDDRYVQMNPGGKTGFVSIKPEELNTAGCLLAANLRGLVVAGGYDASI